MGANEFLKGSLFFQYLNVEYEYIALNLLRTVFASTTPQLEHK